MAQTYRIVWESTRIIYIEITGEIGLQYVDELWTFLDKAEAPICILLHISGDAGGNLTTVHYLQISVIHPMVTAVAAFDMTSAQALLVEQQLQETGIETFRVFDDEQAARQYLRTICGESPSNPGP